MYKCIHISTLALGSYRVLKCTQSMLVQFFASISEHDSWRDYNTSTIRILNSAAAYTRENWSVFLMIEKWHHPPYKSLDKAVEAANRVSFDGKGILPVLDNLQIDEIHIGGHESPISSVMKYNGYCSSLQTCWHLSTLRDWITMKLRHCSFW